MSGKRHLSRTRRRREVWTGRDEGRGERGSYKETCEVDKAQYGSGNLSSLIYRRAQGRRYVEDVSPACERGEKQRSARLTHMVSVSELEAIRTSIVASSRRLVVQARVATWGAVISHSAIDRWPFSGAMGRAGERGLIRDGERTGSRRRSGAARGRAAKNSSLSQIALSLSLSLSLTPRGYRDLFL